MTPKFQLNLVNSTHQDLSDLDFQAIAQKILPSVQITDILFIIDIKICGTTHIRNLNRRYRNIDKPTDVLSFPLVPLSRGQLTGNFEVNPDSPLHLGDIVICYEVAAKQADQNNIPVKKEIENLLEHGLKHLLGFHHK